MNIMSAPRKSVYDVENTAVEPSKEIERFERSLLGLPRAHHADEATIMRRLSQLDLNEKVGNNAKPNVNDDCKSDTSTASSDDSKSSRRCSLTQPRLKLEDFEPVCQIGKGAFGDVFLVRMRRSKRLFAMKAMPKALLVRKKCVESSRIERDVMRVVNHPFIVQLRFSFQTNRKVYLIMDYVSGGDLFDRIPLRESHAKVFAAELVLALEYLHDNDILYRDLKPENCLLTSDGHVCLTDFGLAKVDFCAASTTRSFCGTLNFMAPEVVNRSLPYGQPADWWALGCLIHEMVTGHAVFPGKDEHKVKQRIVSGKIKMRNGLTPELRSLLKLLLTRDPNRRAKAQQIKQHLWFCDINWKSVEKKKIPPPLGRPQDALTEDSDTRFFERAIEEHFGDAAAARAAIKTAFTPTTPQLGPLSPSIQAQFAGFSYVNESFLSPLNVDGSSDEQPFIPSPSS
ncbi:MAG: hypothetical protein MHM6MM_005644 [Cercozoa sp. M6MM]